MPASSIEWTDRTFQFPIWGCKKAGPECNKCWAMSMAHRLSAQGIYPAGITCSPGEGDKGAQWTGKVIVGPMDSILPAAQKGLPTRLRKHGRRHLVFVQSMADLFHKEVPFDFLDECFRVMELYAGSCIFQALTKRADRMAEYDADRARRGLGWPANVWAGVTVGTNAGLWRVDELHKVRAEVRFLSCEPLLEELNLSGRLVREIRVEGRGFGDPRTGLDGKVPVVVRPISWVIAGSESGARPRSTELDWFRSLRNQCQAASVPFFLKQGDVGDGLESLPLLDGQQWAQFPAEAG